VPSAPRDLRLTLTQEEPPVVLVEWLAPRIMHGTLTGYRLTYGIRGEDNHELRIFEAEKAKFTTGFLGQLSLCCRQYGLTFRFA